MKMITLLKKLARRILKNDIRKLEAQVAELTDILETREHTMLVRGDYACIMDTHLPLVRRIYIAGEQAYLANNIMGTPAAVASLGLPTIAPS
jgi:hypothetical protein